jgi:hypothetical protein
MRKAVLPVLLLAVVLVLGSWAYSRAASQKKPSGISVVKAILVQNCAVAGCHRANMTDMPVANLNLDRGRFPASVLDVPSAQLLDYKLVDTKSSEKSYLLMKIEGDPQIQGSRMPINRTPLNAQQIQEVKDWIMSLKSQ